MAVVIWYRHIPAPWLPDMALPPWAIVDGSRVTVHNIRNFDYRSETDYI